MKNYKVAGSSVDSFFGQFCINPVDKAKYIFEDRHNVEISEFGIIGGRGANVNYSGWGEHKTAEKIKKDLGDEMFNTYFKFCVVRNPYDYMVSSFFWDRCVYPNKCKDDFKSYCKDFYNGNNELSPMNNLSRNNLTRILINDKPICQYYIRYEKLVDDIVNVLGKLGITDYNIKDLPKFKSGQRKDKRHYSEFYDEETKGIVTKMFQKEIEMFDYKF